MSNSKSCAVNRHTAHVYDGVLAFGDFTLLHYVISHFLFSLYMYVNLTSAWNRTVLGLRG